MDESRWTRDPVVAVAGGGLLLDCLGWTAWAVDRWIYRQWPDVTAHFPVVAIFVGIAAVLAACAVGVLRGLRGFAVAAACAVVLFTGFIGPNAVAAANLTVVGLLVWANARLRGPAGEAGRAARRDPVVAAAGGACAAAAGACAAWLGIWVWQSDILNPPIEEWFSPWVGIVFRAVPALLLAAAAAGVLRGSVAWAAVAPGPILVIGGAAAVQADGVAATTALVVLTLALLVVVGYAFRRLLRSDSGHDEPRHSDPAP